MSALYGCGISNCGQILNRILRIPQSGDGCFYLTFIFFAFTFISFDVHSELNNLEKLDFNKAEEDKPGQ